jgi:hypothetical protein
MTSRAYEQFGKRLIAYLSVAITMTCWMAPCCGVPRLTILSLARDSLLVKALYSDPHRIVSGVASDGSVGVNTSWQQAKSDTWYIEQQRYGGDLVQAGVCLNDDLLINQGLKILDWGFEHQDADGSFHGTGDAFDGTSMFAEAAARALLLLKKFDRVRFARAIQTDLPKLKAALRWLQRPDVMDSGKKQDAPYTHRRFILAAAFAETEALKREPRLYFLAAEFAQDGLHQQTPNGVYPEKGGYDASYQAVSLAMLERYYVLCEDPLIAQRVASGLKDGLNWLATKIGSSGTVDLSGSTMVGVESGRTGKKKTFDYQAALQALANGSSLTGISQYRSCAEALAKRRGWLK